MIGLGSNRLSVCRRGGMSVTQAGKGGMEWLEGNGKRRESPYSAAATAALKDAFTAAQWQTIKAYGFAHPEIVGYMNAYAPEDAKIAYSLVPTLGYDRWIFGNDSAYADLDYYPLMSVNDFSAESKFAITANNTDTNILGGWHTQSGRCYPIAIYNNRPFYGLYGTNVGLNSTPVVTQNEPHIAFVEYLHSESRQYMKIDGVQTVSSTIAETTDVPYNWYVMARNNSNFGPVGNYLKGGIVYCKSNEVGRREFYLVPYEKSDHRKGFIDLISGTFYPDASGNNGFTIKVGNFVNGVFSETPAS